MEEVWEAVVREMLEEVDEALADRLLLVGL